MDAGSAVVLVTLLLLSIVWFLGWSTGRKRSKLPPGPAPWPILGNLWQKDVLPLYRTYDKVREELEVPDSLPAPSGQQERKWEHPMAKLNRNCGCHFFPTFLSSFSLPLVLLCQDFLNPCYWEHNQCCY
uniref:Cytochrome P450 n=1 Tax=Calidris pygmaea TaxID=425635 RepID=A0A8C3PN49_9CHAR